MDIHLHLMARPGTGLADIRHVASYPHALAQCQKFLAGALPGVEQRAANSTADAARVLGESGCRRRGGHRAAARRGALRPGDRRRGRRGPPGQPDPLRPRRPDPRPEADGPRQDEHRLLPAGRPPGQPARHPRPVRRPQHQPDQAGVTPDQAGPRRLLLRHRPLGPRRRRGRGRLPAGPACRAGGGQVPRLVPCGRASTGPSSGGRPTPPGRPPTTGCAGCGALSSSGLRRVALQRPRQTARQHQGHDGGQSGRREGDEHAARDGPRAPGTRRRPRRRRCRRRGRSRVRRRG